MSGPGGILSAFDLSRPIHNLGVSHADLVALWCGQEAQAVVAIRVGVNVVTLRKLVAALCLPKRAVARRIGVEAVMERLARDSVEGRVAPGHRLCALPPAPVIEVLDPPFWTPARDVAVLATKGRYAAINALAAELAVPATRITGRWHVLRAR